MTCHIRVGSPDHETVTRHPPPPAPPRRKGADPNPGVTDEALVNASGKLRTLDRLLARLLGAGQ